MDNKDEIERILADFSEKKQSRDNGTAEPLPPPVRREEYIDFSKKAEEPSQEQAVKPKKEKKPALTPEQKEQKRQARTEAIKKIKSAVFSKRTLIIIIAVALIIGAVFGGMAISENLKTAYLKPYLKKYPDVNFPVGISEKYCDMLGKNPDAVGYIEIGDTGLKSAVYNKKSKSYPMSEDSTKGSRINNYVVYLNDNSLETFYKDVASYNSSNGFITYSDLVNDYTFKVVGAFYTNTKAEDDDGYIFPYNVTEEMTAKCSYDFLSMLNARFLYNTGITITRQEKLLTISCDTDYIKDFRFVVVAISCADSSDKPVATEKSRVRYPQAMYSKLGIDKVPNLADKWYPEIVVTDNNSNEKIIKQSIKDYE